VEEGVEARTYNFYTFPRPFKGKHARDVVIDPECVEFHKRVGTDFQKWIVDGIGYYDK
jgi:CAF1 family ribonuclease